MRTTWKLRGSALIAGTLLLNACGTVATECPPVREYSADFQDALAEEVVAMGEGFPLTIEALSDYAVVRDQLRACRGS